jgi:hypothetical protein
MQIASFLARGSTSGRRVITISMFGRRRSASRNYATSIATFGVPSESRLCSRGGESRSSADWWRSRKIGNGAASSIT